MPSINEGVAQLTAVAHDEYAAGVVDGMRVVLDVLEAAVRVDADLPGVVANVRAVLEEHSTS